MNKCTINDLVMGMAAVSIKKYMIKRGETDKDKINTIIPFSMRMIPKDPKDIMCANDFSALAFTLDLSTDINDAVKKIRKTTRGLKNSLYPHGMRALGELSFMFPNIIGQILGHFIVSKSTMAFSNVPGPKKGIRFSENVKAHSFIALVPGMGDLAFGMTGMSLCDNVYFAIQSDTAFIDNPAELR